MTGAATLYAGGRQVGTPSSDGSGEFDVPADAESFRLHTSVDFGMALSTKVVSDRTFKSAATNTVTALPLLAIRYTPALDQKNRAPAAVPTLVPMSVDHNAGARASVTAVQVSHDDGVTWRGVAVISLNGKQFALVSHPAGAKAVSLKASAQDAGGSAVEQTIVRAFVLK